MRKSRMYKTTIALVWMAVFPSMVFGSVIVMNRSVEEPKEEKGGTQVVFSVKKQQPKKQETGERKPAPQKKHGSAPAAPLPDLVSTISVVELGLPPAGLTGMQSLTKSVLGDVQSVVMTQESVDTPPRPSLRVPAVYPEKARAKGITGYVLFNLLIDVDGSVRSVKILDASPPGAFEEAASSAVSRWTFEPASYKGSAVKVWAKQKISFSLK